MYGMKLRTLVLYKGKRDMSEMSKELQNQYFEEAEKHAYFLTEKVFKPAFVMAFIHGIKHGREDLAKEIIAEAKKQNE